MKRVRLDIDLIPEPLYQMLIEEFKRQHGNAYYESWDLYADKVLEEDDYEVIENEN